MGINGSLAVGTEDSNWEGTVTGGEAEYTIEA